MSDEPSQRQGEACEVPGALIRRWGLSNFLRLLLIVTVGAAIPATVVGALAGARAGAGVGFAVWYLGFIVTAIAMAIMSRHKPGPPAEVRATKEGVWVGGKLVATRSEIETGVVVPETVPAPTAFSRSSGVPGPPMLRLEMKGALARPVEIRVGSVEDGRRLLAALELDAAHAVGVASARSPWIKWSAAAYAASIVLLGTLPFVAKAAGGTSAAAVGAVLMLGFVASMVSMLVPMHVVVGTDGVALQWAWWKRFIPMSDIRDVLVDTSFGGAVVLHLASGETQRIPFRGSGRGSGAYARTEATTLKERIDEAMAVDPKDAAAGDVTKALARGSGPLAEWVKRLRGAVRTEATFREAAVFPEQLWSVVEDARTPTTDRAAAAVALAGHLDEPGRERLRVTAASTASPKLRFALEAATRDDDDELERALEELEAEEAAESAVPGSL